MSSRALRPALTRAAVLVSTAALTLTGVVGVSSAEPGDAAPDPAGADGFELGADQPALAGRLSADKAPSSALARTPRALTRLKGSAPVLVMIKLDYDAVASYTGTVRGLEATSPSLTAKALSADTAAVRGYESYVADQESTITRRMETAAPGLDVGRSFRTVYGGVSARVPGNQIPALLDVPGVVAVQRDTLRQALTDSSTEFINAPAAYNQLPGGRRDAGKGIILANIDTGVWPEHPSLADLGNLPPATGPERACEFGDNPLTPADDPFECNNKLIGGQATLDTYEANNDDLPYPGSARDAEGHGSHTTSTSAGNIVDDVQTVGPVIDQINGVAPGAWVLEYRALGPLGGYGSDLTAAVEQAILDGADVINYSVSGGSSPMTDPTELAFLDAYNAGVFVAASAGNSGPGASTSDHLAPWTTTVAASTQERSFTSDLTVTSGDGATYDVKGASITSGAGPLPVVDAAAAPYSDARCTSPAPPGLFAGKIVVCERGANARVSKGYNVLQGDAEGMVLYNPTLADVETDNHWLPTVHVADGTDLRAFMTAHSDLSATFTDGRADRGQGDVMAAFSSRGPGGNFIKPDITGPGVQILADMTPTPEDPANGPEGEYYQAIAGTSMSAPHIAGAAILIKALHPSWSPGQIKSAMMTQAVTSVVKEDETTQADPFDMGSGRIDIGKAAKAPLTISDTGSAMASHTANPVNAIDLNIPSINAPTMPGSITTSRRIVNVTGKMLKVRARSSLPARTWVSFSRSDFKLRPGQSKRVEITLRSRAPIGQQQFGAVHFVTDRGDVRLPLAFIHRQGTVNATQSCSPRRIRHGKKTVCTVSATNNDFDDQGVSLTTSVSKHLKIKRTSAGTLRGGKVKVVRSLKGARLGVPTVSEASDTPGGGYLPLGLFGIEPEPVGDEDMLNYDVPAFSYNGKMETKVGVDSNGYLVVGGGTSEDNQCCDLPDGPSPTVPNNILAPFWTDLNGEGAPGISLASLTDGTNSWLVVQWEVNVYGTDDRRAFQMWLGTDGPQDVTFEYETPQTDPGQPYLVGAENPSGAGDVSAFLPTGSLRVTSTDPAPGDTLTYRMRIRGKQRGPGHVRTRVEAEKVPGATLLDTPVKVLRKLKR